MAATPKELTNILLVEDDEVDVLAVKRGFVHYQIDNPLHVARDGIQALEMLRGTNGVKAIPRPLLILLDLNTPRMNGLQFLTELRSDPDLCDHVVFVLTTSNSSSDRAAAYQKNVAGYIVKDCVGDGFLQVIQMLECFLLTVDLPESRPTAVPDSVHNA